MKIISLGYKGKTFKIDIRYEGNVLKMDIVYESNALKIDIPIRVDFNSFSKGVGVDPNSLDQLGLPATLVGLVGLTSQLARVGRLMLMIGGGTAAFLGLGIAILGAAILGVGADSTQAEPQTATQANAVNIGENL